MWKETAHDLKHFTDLVKDAKKHLAKGPDGPCQPSSFWFRGHDRHIYTLIPSLYRYQNGREREKKLFDAHERTACTDSHYRKYSWKTIIHMQHYGIPTRLLDWTMNEWIAAFFALPPKVDRPRIYILNPRRLNQMNCKDEPIYVPRDRSLPFEESFLGNSMEFPVAITPVVPKGSNPRLESQQGCFTVQGKNPDPLEYQAPDCLACIELSEKAVSEMRNSLPNYGVPPNRVFPDHEGVARFVMLEAQLQSVDYDMATGERIVKQLRTQAQEHLRLLMNHEQDRLPHSKGRAYFNLDDAYIGRDDEVKRLAQWLDDGPPILFVTGEAGMGKTNFVLHSLLRESCIGDRPFLFFSFKFYRYADKERSRAFKSEQELARRLCEAVLPEGHNEQDAARWWHVTRKMIAGGKILVVFDGLDELARVKSEAVVEDIARELHALFGQHKEARIVITCRDHILKRLEALGALGKAVEQRPLQIGPFSRQDVEKKLKRYFDKPPHYLVELARTPLLYEMIRRARAHGDELIAAGPERTKLEEAWFEIMLHESGYRKADLKNLGAIAGRMLQNRCDLIEVSSLPKPVDLGPMIQKLMEGKYVLFTEESTGVYSFSHQAFREFVLAWCVAEEIRSGEYDLLKSNSSFDYEGGEFYSRVLDLLAGCDVLKHMDKKLRDAKGLNADEWNHLARNLFELAGMLMPDDDELAAAVTKVAIRYIKPKSRLPQRPSYLTRYNIARCLERIHYSAPREPYCKYILRRPEWPKTPNRNNVGAYAVRGFQMETRVAGPLPPTEFPEKLQDSEVMQRLEPPVSNALMAVIAELSRLQTLSLEAHFLGINCCHSLIRWLPAEPRLLKNMLRQITRLLRLTHVSIPMKQNIFYALFRRYGTQIPSCFRTSRAFHGIAPLSWRQNKNISWACEDAKRALERLAPGDGEAIWRNSKLHRRRKGR